MENYIKNSWKIAATIAMLATSWSLLSAAGTYSNSISPDRHRSFTVQGEGKVTTKPDIAEFSVSVSTEGKTTNLAETQKENAEKNNAIIAFIKESGVKDDDIKTSGYSIEPRYEYPNCAYLSICPPAKIIGYTVRNTVNVKIRDFEKISPILSGVVLRGANNLSGPSFGIDDQDELKSRAREEAINKAKKEALKIAKASGIRVGRIMSINEDYSPVYPAYRSYMKVMDNEAAISAPVIEPGSEEITVNVTIVYEIL